MSLKTYIKELLILGVGLGLLILFDNLSKCNSGMFIGGCSIAKTLAIMAALLLFGNFVILGLILRKVITKPLLHFIITLLVSLLAIFIELKLFVNYWYLFS